MDSINVKSVETYVIYKWNEPREITLPKADSCNIKQLIMRLNDGTELLCMNNDGRWEIFEKCEKFDKSLIC